MEINHHQTNLIKKTKQNKNNQKPTQTLCPLAPRTTKVCYKKALRYEVTLPHTC